MPPRLNRRPHEPQYSKPKIAPPRSFEPLLTLAFFADLLEAFLAAFLAAFFLGPDFLTGGLLRALFLIVFLFFAAISHSLLESSSSSPANTVVSGTITAAPIARPTFSLSNSKGIAAATCASIPSTREKSRGAPNV